MDLSLSNKFVLRKNIGGDNILYDKSCNVKYQITDKLFIFLYLFKDNVADLDSIFPFFEKNEISTDDIKAFLAREDMKNVLVPSTISHRTEKTNIYNTLSPITKFTEYTPERVDFLITKKCNLKCKHCFENSSPIEKSQTFDLNVLKSVFRQMDDLNVKTLKITGGEPFSHPQFLSVLEEVSKSRFETIILTNGILLTEQAMNMIKVANIKLGISLDGISNTTHDFLRGKGAFDVLFKKLKYLGHLGVDLTLTFTANKMNESELERFADVAFNEIGARSVFINRLRPIGRANTNADIFIPNDKYQLVKDRVHNLTQKYGNDKVQLSDDSTPIEVQSQEQLTADSPLVCAAGNTLLCIDEFLDVYPCIYGQGKKEYSIGNLSEDSLLNIWLSEKWLPYRGKTTLSQIKGCNVCNKKEICGVKTCRLKPIYNGQSFYDHISYCKE